MRRETRARGTIAAGVALLIGLLIAASAASASAAAAPVAGQFSAGDQVAADQSAGVADDVVVSEGETIHGDLTATAGDVIVHGTVEGDVEAAAGSVVVTGEVTGGVEAAAGDVTVEGRVGDDVDAAAGSVDVAEGATVDGDVTAAAGTTRIDGTVDGDVQSSETVRLGSEALVTGDVEYGEAIDRADGAVVEGTVSESDFGWNRNVDLTPGPASVLFSGFWAAATLLLGGSLLVVAPEFSADLAARVSEDPVRSGGAGVVALIGAPSVLVILTLTIVGIPLALAGGALFAIVLWIAAVYGGFAVATAGLASFDVENRWAALLVGIGGFEALSLIPVVGDIAQLALVAVGLGAGALVVAERRRDGDGQAPTPDGDLRVEGDAPA